MIASHSVLLGLARQATTALPSLEQIIRWLLYIYVFSLFFPQLLFIERNGFILLLVLLLMWCVRNGRHFYVRTPMDMPLLAFVVWVGMTIPFAVFPNYSVKEFGKLLQQALIFYAVAFFFKDLRDKRNLVWVLIGSLLIKSLLGICGRIWEIAFEPKEPGGMILGPIIQADVWLTTHLVMLIPISIAVALIHQESLQRKICIGVTGTAVACLLLLQSQAGLLAVLCELWMLALYVPRKGFVIGLFGLSAVLLLGVLVMLEKGMIMLPGTSKPIVRISEASREHRLDIWKFSLARIREHPIVGIGYGKESFKMVFGQEHEDVQPGRWPVRDGGTHNTFLGIALETGIGGLGLFVWLLYRMAVHSLQRFRDARDELLKAFSLGVMLCVIGLTVRLFFDHMFVSTIAVLFMVLVALTTAAESRANDEMELVKSAG